MPTVVESSESTGKARLGRHGANGARGSNPRVATSAPRLVKLLWREAFEVGHPLIDADHRRLFLLGNRVIESIVRDEHGPKLQALLQQLFDHIAQHFRFEEDVLARTGHPLSFEHRAVHRRLLERSHELMASFEAGTLPVGALIGFIVYDVVAQHIVKDDPKVAREEIDLDSIFGRLELAPPV
ncbi:MAG: hemerythrin family protein [Burkholderiaceae bacterium]